MKLLGPLVPGLFVATGVAAAARLTSRFVPSGIGEVLVAVLLGLLVANFVALPEGF